MPEIVAWFQRRQIQVRTSPDAVNTTGFFDEFAVEIGDNYPLLGDVVGKIRWAQQKDVPTRSASSSRELSQKDGQAINAFCKRLYEHTFLAKYFYQKQDKLGRATIQSAPAIRSFFAGDWLEWYALMKLLAFFREGQRIFSCARNLSVVCTSSMCSSWWMRQHPGVHRMQDRRVPPGHRQIPAPAQTPGHRPEPVHPVLPGPRMTSRRLASPACTNSAFVNPTGLQGHLAKLF
jgi:hypothetical protein